VKQPVATQRCAIVRYTHSLYTCILTSAHVQWRRRLHADALLMPLWMLLNEYISFHASFAPKTDIYSRVLFTPAHFARRLMYSPPYSRVSWVRYLPRRQMIDCQCRVVSPAT